jgi:hypothetical protein
MASQKHFLHEPDTSGESLSAMQQKKQTGTLCRDFHLSFSNILFET